MLLLILALLPAAVLMMLIRHMDRNEREPLSLVLKVFSAGAAACIPAAIIEVLLGAATSPAEGSTTDLVLSAFFKVSLVEEAMKLIAVMLVVWKRPEFNEENDGIVYVGAAALGFAALENVFYVLGSGVGTGVARAVSAVPLHCFTGVIMGWFLGLARCSDSSAVRYVRITQGFVIAVVIHGLYDALLFTGTDATILVIPILIALVAYGYRVMKRGRAASIARWAVPADPEAMGRLDGMENRPFESVPAPLADAASVPASVPKWKKVVALSLIIPSALLWLLLLIGIFFEAEGGGDVLEVIMGGAILTFIPVLVGVLLLRSGAQRR